MSKKHALQMIEERPEIVTPRWEMTKSDKGILSLYHSGTLVCSRHNLCDVIMEVGKRFPALKWGTLVACLTKTQAQREHKLLCTQADRRDSLRHTRAGYLPQDNNGRLRPEVMI